MRNRSLAALFFAALFIASTAHARAIPIYAQRYHFSCKQCHTVLPELNAFGLQFRQHGYQLPLPRHGTTVVALRYQLEWEQTPSAGSRRWQPAGVILSNADIGRISAFIHYNLGAAGGPAGLYLGYLATYNEHTQTLYRAGLFELPLAQSPGQRLDSLQQYGYYGTHVGLNDLPLSSPRWGLQIERTVGAARYDFIADYGEFKGSAYGGKPLPTGETTNPATPEVGLFARAPVLHNFEVGGMALTGTRNIVQTNTPAFQDGYSRYGLLLRGFYSRFDLQAEQWWGRDANADGFGSVQYSSGGYARLKYYVNPHAYLGIRYDAAANPIVVRDMVYYGAFQLLPTTRFLLQQVQTIGGHGAFGGAITIGFPPPLHTQ